MEPRHLKLLTGADAEEVQKPNLSQVIYKLPNPNKERKKCGNCVFWASVVYRCHLHDPDVLIPVDAICGYHVCGTGSREFPREHIDPVTPDLSGLQRVPGGVSCDSCTHYRHSGKKQGTCVAVRDQLGENALVAAFGSCTRWVERG